MYLHDNTLLIGLIFSVVLCIVGITICCIYWHAVLSSKNIETNWDSVWDNQNTVTLNLIKKKEKKFILRQESSYKVHS